jgi:uncharacterized protein (TIGR00369 family)
VKTLNPLYVQAVRASVNPCPYFELLSMEIAHLGWGESTVTIEVQRKHLQPYGIVHGGVFASLIDATAFWAAYTQLPEELEMTSVDLKLNYLAPLAAGRMLARGKCLRAGNTLYLAEASVSTDAGQLLAHGTSTLMVLKNATMERKAGWPSKYLD